MTTTDAVRFLLTILVLVVLAVWAGWTWFWAFLALAVFGEAWALGYKFLQKRQ
jgi:hypothetical protein